MNMPGFTADASFYRTKEIYHMVVSLKQAEGVIPQQFESLEYPESECGPMRPLFTYFEECSPCRRVMSFLRLRDILFPWRQRVRECTWFESLGCPPSVVCSPCFEVTCSPFTPIFVPNNVRLPSNDFPF